MAPRLLTSPQTAERLGLPVQALYKLRDTDEGLAITQTGHLRWCIRLDLPEQEIRVSNKNSADFECFRFDDLNFFYGMSERERLQRRI